MEKRKLICISNEIGAPETMTIVTCWKDFASHPDYSLQFIQNWWHDVVGPTEMRDVSERDTQEQTLLFHAIAGCIPDAVEELLNNGADVNAVAKNGYTAFHMLGTMLLYIPFEPDAKMARDASRVISLLLKNGAKDVPSADGITIAQMVNHPTLRRKLDKMNITFLP